MTVTVNVLKERSENLRKRIVEDTARADAIDAFISQPGVEHVLALLGESIVADLSGPSEPEKGKKSGRPKGSVKKDDSVEKKSRKPRQSRDGQPSLKSIIVDTLDGKENGLSLKEIVAEVLNKGYKSNAKDFTTVVYQNLYALLKKDNKVENKDHRYVLKSAA
jgi:hypothetical protein